MVKQVFDRQMVPINFLFVFTKGTLIWQSQKKFFLDEREAKKNLFGVCKLWTFFLSQRWVPKGGVGGLAYRILNFRNHIKTL